MGITELWTFSGTIDRVRYGLLGGALFLAKFGLDSGIARLVFQRSWSPLNYLSQEQAGLWRRVAAADHLFFATMLLLALPFVWVGVALTVKRLRGAALPLWMAFLFFVPVVNLLFFFTLVILPSRQRVADASEGTTHLPSFSTASPARRYRSAWFSMVVTAVIGALLTKFNISALGVYGMGLFVGLPFSLGLIAAIVHGYHGARGCAGCVGVGVAAVAMVAAIVFVVGIEGGACLIMAAPIWLVCAALGAMVGYLIQQHARDQRESALLIVGLTLAVPALMGAEYVLTPEPPLFVVRSSVDVTAPPEKVWSHVVAFPDLPPPKEWLFQTGVAYPMSAVVHGHGVGAERRCVFSTGSFVEPILVWDEPRHLGFSVTENPPPMREWNWFGNVDPPHLHGFLVSRAGEFRLSPLPEGGTRLEGTTWYHHNMWPAGYWRLWSDFIIHRIHLRVLNHVRILSEQHQLG